MIDLIKAAASCRAFIFAMAMGILSIHLTGCTQPEKKMATKTIEDVLNEYTDQWMSIDGVVGTAQGLVDDKPCIKVYVVEKTPELERKVPELLHGYPVVMEETGELKALPENQD